MDRYEISEVNLSKSEYICFELFEVWALNLSLKEETMKNIHNQNVAELAHYIIVFYKQGLGACFGNTGMLVPRLSVSGVLFQKSWANVKQSKLTVVGFIKWTF